MINNCRKNKTTIIGVGLLDPSSLSLYTITESQYLETINNDDNNNSSTCNSSTNIRTISFADTDEGDEDDGDDDYNDDNENDENVNDDEDATLRTSSRWDTNSTSPSTSTRSNNMKSASLLLQQQQQQQQSCMSKTINRDNDVRIDCPPTRPVRRKASTTI